MLYSAYRNFRHSSNILTKAALFEKPVIVSRGHLMAERVERFRLGVAIEQDSAAECAGALRRLCGADRPSAGAGASRFDDYLRRHSQASFRAQLAELLGEPA